MQRNTDVLEDLAQHTVAGPVAIGELVQLRPVSLVVARGTLERGVGDHEARPTMREDLVGNLGFGPKIPGLAGVESGKPGQQRRPRHVGVGLHEDIPLGIGFGTVRLLGHGQELPLVQLPARVIGFAHVGVGLVGEIVLLESLAPALGEAVVDVEVRHGALDGAVHGAQDIVDLDALDLLLEVREDHVVGDAAEGG